MNRGRFTYRPDGFTKGGRQIGQGVMAGLLLIAVYLFVYYLSFRPLLERREILMGAMPVNATVVLAGPDAVRSYRWMTYKRQPLVYEPAVRFAYTVDGRAYEADAYSCDKVPMQKVDAVLLGGSYGVGQKVTAWYPAGQPSQAFLVKAYEPMNYAGLLLLGPAILVCGGVMLTALVPMGSLDHPDPRAKVIAGGIGSVVSVAAFTHMVTQGQSPLPGGVWLMACVLAGLPVLALVWGAWLWATDR